MAIPRVPEEALVTTIGPVEYVIVGFPGSHFRGEIVPTLAELIEAGTIRVLDVVFVKKDIHGDICMFEYDALDDLAGTGFAELEGAVSGVLSDQDVIMAAEVLEPDTSAALIVFEHLWATRAAEAVRRAGGQVIPGERIPPEVIRSSLGEVALA